MKAGMQRARISLNKSPNYDRSKGFDYFKAVSYKQKYLFSDEPKWGMGGLGVDGVSVSIQWMLFPNSHLWHIFGSASEGWMVKIGNEGWGVVSDFRSWKHFDISDKDCKPSNFVKSDVQPSLRAQIVIEKIVGEFCKWKSRNSESKLLKQFESGTR